MIAPRQITDIIKKSANNKQAHKQHEHLATNNTTKPNQRGRLHRRVQLAYQMEAR